MMLDWVEDGTDLKTGKTCMSKKEVVMKVSEINKSIKQYIAPALKGYFVHKDLLYKVENNYLLKGFYFESRGNDDLDLAVWYFIQPLFIKKDGIILTLGDRLSYRKKLNLLRYEELEWWDARKENLEKTFSLIAKSIISDGEKRLSEINSVEGLYKYFFNERKENIRIYEAVAYSTVLFGDESFQTKPLNDLVAFCNTQIETKDDIVEIQIREDASNLLQANSKEKRLAILNTWANETIEHLKLPHLKSFI